MSRHASGVHFDERAKLFRLDIHPPWLTSDLINASKQQSSDLLRFAREGFSLSTLRRLRKRFPHVALIFRDRNVDSEIFAELEIGSSYQAERLETVIGPNPAHEGRRRAERVPFGVIIAITEDILDLAAGLWNEDPTATYYYCLSASPHSSNVLVRAVEQARSADDLIPRLADACETVLSAGPDAYYLEVVSRDRSNLWDE